MDFNDLLRKHEIEPSHVLVLRHTPKEPRLKEWLPRLANDRPAIYNAYQQTQPIRVEKAMRRATYVASFIGKIPGSAIFVGLYRRHGEQVRSPRQLQAMPAHQVLEGYGTPPDLRPRLWFDLRLEKGFYPDWKGRLVIQWPSPEISWYRMAHRANFKILTIHEESQLCQAPPGYTEWDRRWDDLSVLPESWKAKLREWRGVYLIFDTSDGKGYVGSASGKENMLGRWRNYAKRGDGGNKELRTRDPSNLRFSILELVGQSMERKEVNMREENWKLRLRTRTRTHGLNLPKLDY